jgi:hypothetical protein
MIANLEIHPFEAAGLGKAPFRYVGMEFQDISYGQRNVAIGGVECQTKPGGTCAYCGQYIVNMFRVASADGQEFHVGCDCIRKVDAKLVKLADQDIRKMRKERKAAADRATVQAARELLPVAMEKMAGKPHPNAHMAGNGKTLADYVDFLLQCGGNDGRLRAAKLITQNA